MPKLTIDGREVEAEAGKTILQAALAVGGEIPHYCYHPGLSIAGNCRMCLVEVEKAPKLLIACDTRVKDGMVVNTDNDRVRAARTSMMEFFLINHPLDCPICDQAGECRLQEYAMHHGSGTSRYTEPKNASEKAVDIGRHVMLDQERCIQCSRCTRFCDEITGTGELTFFRRGESTVIGVVPDRPLDNPYSGNVVDICPVGALTLKEFRFKTRVWYLQNTPTVCAACSRGCNVFVSTGTQRLLMSTQGQQDERIKRIVPRYNDAVNDHWVCDEGRLSYQRLYDGERLRRARTSDGDATWDDAVSEAASILKGAGGKVGLLISPRITSEDMLAWRLFLETLGGGTIGVRRLVSGEDDDILIRADKGANSRGASWILGDDATEDALLAAASDGALDALVIVGDSLDTADTVPLDDAVAGKIGKIVYVGPFDSATAATASVLLPSAAWSEEDGTIVNFEGRIQRVRRAHAPHGEGRPGWRVVRDLAEAADLSMPAWTHSDDVLASLVEHVREYNGLESDSIGMLGVPGNAAATV